MLVTVGLGYLIVSLVLKFKRIGSTLVIFQYVYLGILLINFENYPLSIKYLSFLLPICPMVSWMRLIVNQRTYNFSFYLMSYLFNEILWLVIGFFIFEITNQKVRKAGSLAAY